MSTRETVQLIIVTVSAFGAGIAFMAWLLRRAGVVA